MTDKPKVEQRHEDAARDLAKEFVLLATGQAWRESQAIEIAMISLARFERDHPAYRAGMMRAAEIAAEFGVKAEQPSDWTTVTGAEVAANLIATFIRTEAQSLTTREDEA